MVILYAYLPPAYHLLSKGKRSRDGYERGSWNGCDAEEATVSLEKIPAWNSAELVEWLSGSTCHPFVRPLVSNDVASAPEAFVTGDVVHPPVIPVRNSVVWQPLFRSSSRGRARSRTLTAFERLSHLLVPELLVQFP